MSSLFDDLANLGKGTKPKPKSIEEDDDYEMLYTPPAPVTNPKPSLVLTNETVQSSSQVSSSTSPSDAASGVASAPVNSAGPATAPASLNHVPRVVPSAPGYGYSALGSGQYPRASFASTPGVAASYGSAYASKFTSSPRSLPRAPLSSTYGTTPSVSINTSAIPRVPFSSTPRHVTSSSAPSGTTTPQPTDESPPSFGPAVLDSSTPVSSPPSPSAQRDSSNTSSEDRMVHLYTQFTNMMTAMTASIADSFGQMAAKLNVPPAPTGHAAPSLDASIMATHDWHGVSRNKVTVAVIPSEAQMRAYMAHMPPVFPEAPTDLTPYINAVSINHIAAFSAMKKELEHWNPLERSNAFRSRLLVHLHALWSESLMSFISPVIVKQALVTACPALKTFAYYTVDQNGYALIKDIAVKYHPYENDFVTLLIQDLPFNPNEDILAYFNRVFTFIGVDRLVAVSRLPNWEEKVKEQTLRYVNLACRNMSSSKFHDEVKMILLEAFSRTSLRNPFSLHVFLRSLETEVDNARARMWAHKQSSKRSSHQNSTDSSTPASAPSSTPTTMNDKQRTLPTTPCPLCKEHGHWRKDCPKQESSRRTDTTAPTTSSGSTSSSPYRPSNSSTHGTTSPTTSSVPYRPVAPTASSSGSPSTATPSSVPSRPVAAFRGSPVLERDHRILLQASVKDIPQWPQLEALVDCGATISLIRRTSVPPSVLEKARYSPTNIVSFNGATVQVNFKVLINLVINGSDVAVDAVVMDAISHDLILGINTLREANTYIEMSANEVNVTFGERKKKTEYVAFATDILFPDDDDNEPSSSSSTTTSPSFMQHLEDIKAEFSDTLVNQLEVGGAAVAPMVDIELLPSSNPINSPGYHANPSKNAILREIVDDMIQKGLAVPITGPWSSPVLLARKKDGSWRFCIDYRRLNEITVPDAYTIPRTDHVTDRLAGAVLFTTLDLVSGYWQLALTPEASRIAAFKVDGRTYAPTVLPFGLRNAPSVFQRTMHSILGHMADFVALYIDDVIIFSKTPEEHVLHVRMVLTALRDANLRVKLSKCTWAQATVEFLGHMVTADGISPRPGLVSAIRNSATPTSVAELQSFLGLSGYYRRFIRDYGTIAAPLTKLLRKDQPWQWTAIEERAFRLLVDGITEDARLVYPRFDGRPFIVDTDASGVGVGMILSQDDDNGVLRPIMFASRALNPAQARYSATEREALAMVTAFRMFKYYLDGNKAIFRTDHKPLIDMIKAQMWTDFTARCFNRMAGHDFTFVYRPGNNHTNADAVSRPPITNNAELLDVDFDDDFDDDIVTATSSNDTHYVLAFAESATLLTDDSTPLDDSPLLTDGNEDVTLSFGGRNLSFAEWQQADSTLQPLFNLVSGEESPIKPRNISRVSKDELSINAQGVLIFQVFRKVVPTQLRNLILNEFHVTPLVGAHAGRDTMKKKIKSRYWWPGMSKEISEFVKHCATCAKFRPSSNQVHGLPQPLQLPSRLFERVSLDISGPLPISEQGNAYILVCTDHYSNWVEAYPIPNMTSQTIIDKLLDQLIPRFGCPAFILTDQGSDFTSSLAHDFYRTLQARKLTTTAYHPQTNGLTERQNGLVKSALAKLLHPNQDVHQWEELLPAVLFALRTHPSEALGGLSPFQVLYGQEARYPMDQLHLDEEQLMFARPFDSQTHEKVTKLRQQANAILRQAGIASSSKMVKQLANKRKPVNFKNGDRVLLERPPNALGVPTFEPKRSGPLRVMMVDPERPNKVTVMMDDGNFKSVNAGRLTQSPEPLPVPSPSAIATPSQPATFVPPAKVHPSQRAPISPLEDAQLLNLRLSYKDLDPRYLTIFDRLALLRPRPRQVLSSKIDRVSTTYDGLKRLVTDLDKILLKKQKIMMNKDIETVRGLCTDKDAQPLFNLIHFWMNRLQSRLGAGFGDRATSTSTQ